MGIMLITHSNAIVRARFRRQCDQHRMAKGQAEVPVEQISRAKEGRIYPFLSQITRTVVLSRDIESTITERPEQVDGLDPQRPSHGQGSCQVPQGRNSSGRGSPWISSSSRAAQPFYPQRTVRTAIETDIDPYGLNYGNNEEHPIESVSVPSQWNESHDQVDEGHWQWHDESY